MKTKNGYDLGSWKCGKGKAFTHIPTNSIILFKKIPFVYGTYKKEENKSLDQKMFDINGFEGFSLKTFDINRCSVRIRR